MSTNLQLVDDIKYRHVSIRFLDAIFVLLSLNDVQRLFSAKLLT